MNIFHYKCQLNTRTKKLCALAFLIIFPFTVMTINRIIHCDVEAERRTVRTPAGLYIQKYNQRIDVRSYRNLSQTCSYVDGRLHCPDIRSKGETMLRQVQLVLTRMLKVIDVICEKHSIHYWLMSGTLLGAYRDKSIIKWDNDADIGMMESDYARFEKIVRSELPEDLFYQDGSDEPSYAKTKSCVAKLRDRNSCYCHCMRTGCEYQDGLQIDIFVFKTVEVHGKRDMLVSVTNGRFKIPFEYVIPPSRIVMEGLEFSAPKQTLRVLETLFRQNFLTPLKNQCPEYGFVAMPWYSCEYINSLPPDKKRKILVDSMIHDSWFFWYFG